MRTGSQDIDWNDPGSIDYVANRLAEEMLDWTEGRRSWANLVMELGNGAAAQVFIAQMDAAETQKLAAAATALSAMAANRRTVTP